MTNIKQQLFIFFIKNFIVLVFIGIICEGGRPPVRFAGLELGDYRVRSGQPFVSLYEHENHRGKVFFQMLRKECTNIDDKYDDWASSIATHNRCVTICEHKNCQGECVAIYPNNKGPKKLTDFRMNDRASSLKYCYT